MNARVEGLNLRSQETSNNPYPVYRTLREIAPVYYDKAVGAWYISSHRDCCEVLSSDAVTATRSENMLARFNDEEKKTLQPLVDFFNKWVLLMDPPQHTIIRKGLHKALASKNVGGMRSTVHDVCTRLLKGVRIGDVFDVVHSYSHPMPAIIMTLALGAEEKDIHFFKEAEASISYVLGNNRPSFERAKMALAASVALMDHLKGIIANAKVGGSSGFLVSELCRLQSEHPSITDDVVLANGVALVYAGSETVLSTIAAAVYLLKTHPEQLEVLRKDRSLLPGAIDEVLRFESPLQRTARFALRDFSVQGHEVKAGDRLVFMLAGANRDPDVFENPEVFDITRKHNPHLTFSYGPHRCVGMAMGKLESETGLGTFLDRIEEYELIDDAPDWAYNLATRGLNKLPIRVTRTATTQ